MVINYDTNKLIILKYPPGAGGKFLNVLLNLHPNILIQEKLMAKYQMKNMSIEFGYELAMKTFKNIKKTGEHFEFGCNQMANFNCYDLEKDIDSDENKSNGFWKELTNQNEFYFFMVEHYAHSLYRKYPNRKTIILENYDWILEGRNKKMKFIDSTPTNSIFFDMNSIQDNMAFNNEFEKIILWLELDMPIKTFDFYNKLESLRTNFLETYKTGFDKEGNWGDQ